jgi:hypothetical protein
MKAIFSEQRMVSLTQCKRVKVALSSHRPRRHAVEAEVFLHSLTTALDVVSGKLHVPAALILTKNPEPGWTVLENRKHLAPTKIRTPDVPVRS